MKYYSYEKMLKNPVLYLPYPPVSFKQFSQFFSSIERTVQFILGLKHVTTFLFIYLGRALIEKDLFFPLSFISAMWIPEPIILQSFSLSNTPPKIWNKLALTGQLEHPQRGKTSIPISAGSYRRFSNLNSEYWCWKTLIIFQTLLGLQSTPNSLHLASSFKFHIRGQQRYRVRSLMQ